MKIGKKVLITIMAAAAAALLAMLGFGLYRSVQTEAPTAPSSVQEEEGSPAPGVLGRLPAAKVDADVVDNLAFAFAKSPDAVAWIQVPGTEINGLVMQAGDNRYYERRNEDGEYDIYGCYFADYECALGAREDFSQNTIIYGHGNSMDDPDGKRFSQLFRFTDLEFAKTHPYVYITTREEKYVFEIFSVFYTDTSFDYIQVSISDEEKLALAKQAEGLSLYDYGMELLASDKLLTLSTCSMVGDTDGSKRFVVMGRLCPASVAEKEKISLSVRKEDN